MSNQGWTFENNGQPQFYAASEGGADAKPVYELYNPINSQHHLVLDKNEYDKLCSDYWWGGEGVAFYAYDLNLKEIKLTGDFNSNDGSKVAKQSVASGSTATKPADPTRDGYVFDGWYTDEALTQSFDFSTPITENITLWAKWVEYSAFAVYSADDNSLDFYKRTDVPNAGDVFNGKTATAVYSGIDNFEYMNRESIPW